MTEDKEPEVIDLHRSQWQREGERVPIFGPGAYPFVVYGISGIIAYAIMSVTVAPLLRWLLY